MRFTSLILVGMLLMSGIAFSEGDIVFLFEFDLHKDGSVDMKDFRLGEGGISPDLEGAGYSVELFSETGELLYKTVFQASFEAHADDYRLYPGQEPVGEVDPIEVEKLNIILRLPYFPEAVKYQIKKADTVLHESNINLCNGNGACEVDKGENYLSCTSDCSSGSEDGFCDGIYDDICDPDCKAQVRQDNDPDCTCGDGVCSGAETKVSCSKDCGRANNYMIYAIVGISLIVLIIVVGLFWLFRGRGKAGSEPEAPSE